MTQEEMDQARVRAALDGQPDAVRALVGTLTPVVQARVARVLLRRQGASRGRDVRQEVEDLSQEVFVALFAREAKVLRSWDPARGMSLRNFVGLVAEREVASILQSGRRSPWKEDPTLGDELDRRAGPSTDHAARVESKEMFLVVLERLRARLSPKGMDLFERLLVRQEDVKSVCAATGMSADAVYAWRSRLGKLVREIAGEIAASDS